jgi:hypothetical protein
MTTEITTTEVPGAQPLKNARHELFAQEVAGGATKTDAYVEFYPGSAEWKRAAVNVKASTLAARPEVQQRIAYLQERAADETVFTKGKHIARLDEISRAAQRAGDFKAAAVAEIHRGKAVGHYPTKVELTGEGGAPLIPLPHRIELVAPGDNSKA